MAEHQETMVHEKPKHGRLYTWTRRALLATGILTVLSQTPAGQQVMKEGQEFANAFGRTPSAENSTANHITTVADGGALRIDLSDKTPYTFIGYTGQTDENTGLPVTDVRVVHANQIEKIEDQEVPDDATAIDVANPAWNDLGEVPFLTTVVIDGQPENGILEADPLRANVMARQGNIRLINGDTETNAQGQITETGTGLRINEITFETSSPTQTASSQ